MLFVHHINHPIPHLQEIMSSVFSLSLPSSFFLKLFSSSSCGNHTPCPPHLLACSSSICSLQNLLLISGGDSGPMRLASCCFCRVNIGKYLANNFSNIWLLCYISNYFYFGYFNKKS